MKSNFKGTATTRCIGLISGTSQDGIDAALVEFEDGVFRCVAATHRTQYPVALRSGLLSLAHESELIALAELADLDRQVAECFADTALGLMAQSDCRPQEIAAIGSHGQTVFHDPNRVRSSIQLGDPGLMAVRTGIPVIADFRRADMALGGQGAPLMPAFHHALFADDREPRAVLNLGGISNLSLLPDTHPERARGFDCGPANCLMDEWTERHLQEPFDREGRWASGGTPDEMGLQACLADPYFGRHPPKSTGRGHFHMDWLAQRWPAHAQDDPQVVQATLCELTARSIADDLRRHAPSTRRLLECGGGAQNVFLMSRLSVLLPGVRVETTAALGLAPQWVEAAGFAWLASRRLRGEAGNLPTVTGASRPAILGGVYHP